MIGPFRRLSSSSEPVVGDLEEAGLALRGRDHRGGDDRGGGVDGLSVEEALHVGPHLARALVAVLDPLGQRLHHDRVQGGRDVGVVRRGGVGLLAHVLVGHGEGRVAHEGRSPGQQLVEQAAGGVDVGAGVHRLPAGLLGGEVLRGADDGGGLGDAGRRLGHRARDAEVHDLDLAAGGQHHVARLDVAVHDAGAVAVLQGVQDAVHDLQGPLGQQLAPVVQHLAQRAALDVLHDDVGLDVAAVGRHLLAGVVDRDDVGVVEPGGGLGLASEAGLEGRVGGEVAAQPLDRDLAAQPHVGAVADLGHAAAAEQVPDLVASPEPHSLVHRPQPPTIPSEELSLALGAGGAALRRLGRAWAPRCPGPAPGPGRLDPGPGRCRRRGRSRPAAAARDPTPAA